MYLEMETDNKEPFVKKIDVSQRVAFKAVELSRDYGLRPHDAIHAACAILKPVDVLQHWDRDFSAVASLISAANPLRITKQIELIPPPLIGPDPERLKPA
jgi:predicted nucleic acid-binding protein